jgi:hypothetical protein
MRGTLANARDGASPIQGVVEDLAIELTEPLVVGAVPAFVTGLLEVGVIGNVIGLVLGTVAGLIVDDFVGAVVALVLFEAVRTALTSLDAAANGDSGTIGCASEGRANAGCSGCERACRGT